MNADAFCWFRDQLGRDLYRARKSARYSPLHVRPPLSPVYAKRMPVGLGTSIAASLRAVPTTNAPASSDQSPEASSAPSATLISRFELEGGPLTPVRPEILRAEPFSRA